MKEQITVFGKLFSRRWWLPTLLVIAGVIVLARLGLWQLDRRDDKRSLNQQMAERWQMPMFDVNSEVLPADLVELEYRRIQAIGAFDYQHQIVIKNDVRNELPGVNLVTPLVLDGKHAILVARGWVPTDQAKPELWSQFDEPAGLKVVGLIKESQTLSGASTPASPQVEWFRVDIAAIQRQMPYTLLPAFIEMLPEPGRKYDALPLRGEIPTPYDELMHTSYAFQWFLFATVLGFGYLQYIIFSERRMQRLQGEGVRPLETEANVVVS